MNMLKSRPARSVFWLAALAGLGCFLALFPKADRAAGQFRVRPTNRAELRAPVSGFLQVLYCEEGSAVTAGAMVGALEVPDLGSRLAQKQAELGEARARLKLLEAGPRHEELEEQREKVDRAKKWRDLATHDLNRKNKALEEELLRLSEQIAQHQVELDNARESLTQSRQLAQRRALALEQLRDAEARYQVAETKLKQAHAQKRERIAMGVQEAEAELARRAKDLADAKGALRLLELGSRPEEIEAQKAHLARVQEETAHLERTQEKLKLVSPVAGVVTTPRLRDKIGHYFKEGDLICEVEDPYGRQVEVLLQEQEVERVAVDQAVTLKPRALPFQAFRGKVEKIAPAAVKEKNDPQGTITVYCRLDEATGELRPGMTGYARIDCGNRPIGMLWLTQVLRYVRTEWW